MSIENEKKPRSRREIGWHAAAAFIVLLGYGVARDLKADPAAQRTQIQTATRHPGHYIWADLGITPTVLNVLDNVPEFQGVSTIYNWVDLELDMDVYDFSQIQQDLAVMQARNKQLIIMIRDKTFTGNPFIPVPAYMRTPEYAGGYSGLVAKRWNPNVAARFRALLFALGNTFNSAPNFEAIKTSESAVGQNHPDYDPLLYATELQNTIDALAQAFPDKLSVLYINWIHQAGGAIPILIEYAASQGVGVGGPDIYPDVAIPTYPVFPTVACTVPVMMDVQYSNFPHVTPAGDTEQLYQFGVDNLGARYLCWLVQPAYYSDNVVATVTNHPAWAPCAASSAAQVPALSGPGKVLLMLLLLMAGILVLRYGARSLPAA